MVMQGNTAPDFTLETDRGAKVTLSQLRGRQVVLCFSPTDDTPGCTIECKEFRDAAPKFEGKALVFGVSELPTALRCRAQSLRRLRHVGPTKWGRGIRRATVIVGADGRIKKVFENVARQGHAAEVLAAL